MDHVEVIVVRCTASGPNCCAYGERLHESIHASLWDAFLEGETHIRDGVAVIVRPNYNEVDASGKDYFREWRAFNAEPLKEVRF